MFIVQINVKWPLLWRCFFSRCCRVVELSQGPESATSARNCCPRSGQGGRWCHCHLASRRMGWRTGARMEVIKSWATIWFTSSRFQYQTPDSDRDDEVVEPHEGNSFGSKMYTRAEMTQRLQSHVGSLDSSTSTRLGFEVCASFSSVLKSVDGRTRTGLFTAQCF